MQDRQEMIAFLEALIDRAAAIEESIGHMESQIERAVQGLASGRDDVAETLEIIAERRKTQLDRMHELGRAQAQIDELENRIQGHDERERQAEHERENAVPAGENHLDWLRPALNAPEPEQELVQGEQRLQRGGREPEDYLDWWKR